MAGTLGISWSTNPGTYALVIELPAPACLHAGRLGDVAFDGGWYVYVGSALGPGGLRGRLARHDRKEKRLKWHIDYLLDRVDLREVWYVEARVRLECDWAGILAGLPGMRVPVQGFGSSDCRCASHLFQSGCFPSFDVFARGAAAFCAAEVQQLPLTAN